MGPNGIVKIFLASGAVVPHWIMARLGEKEDTFSMGFEQLGQKNIRVLTMVGGTASFFYPVKDDVLVKLPGETHQWLAGFEPRAVLQITNGDGSVIERNYWLCPTCFENTGRVLHCTMAAETAEKTLICTNGCKNWARTF